jgi:hypothetical protein
MSATGSPTNSAPAVQGITFDQAIEQWKAKEYTAPGDVRAQKAILEFLEAWKKYQAVLDAAKKNS